jgi:hypothetical protein
MDESTRNISHLWEAFFFNRLASVYSEKIFDRKKLLTRIRNMEDAHRFFDIYLTEV